MPYIITSGHSLHIAYKKKVTVSLLIHGSQSNEFRLARRSDVLSEFGAFMRRNDIAGLDDLVLPCYTGQSSLAQVPLGSQYGCYCSSPLCLAQ
jgi:hypothetical protein